MAKKEKHKCSHWWGYYQLADTVNYAIRTCVRCGEHQEAKLRWITKYKRK